MKKILLYLLVLIVFGLGICLTLHHGRKLEARGSFGTQQNASAPNIVPGHPAALLFDDVREHVRDPLTRFFIQLILILVVARLCGVLALKIHQPAVVGEMLAGILLGPSLLGWVWPDFFSFVFPRQSLGTIKLFSQIGVCLFMFVIGMELDLSRLKKNARTAILVSQVSILFPYLLGVIVSLFLFRTLAARDTTFLTFALFIGISMSITAFPVLARILEERRLTKTALGSTAIACAAAGDVTAWSILAFVVAMAKAASLATAAVSIMLVALFVTGMLVLAKPRLARWIGTSVHKGNEPGRGMIVFVLVFVFASALMTDLMGIHALFGSFLAGVVMPRQSEFRDFLTLRLENFSSVLLLPLFFAFTGLRTEIGLLNNAGDWLLCTGLILIATVGKLGGAMFTARLTGVSWIDSFALGALMNTRGLVELIALNVGYDLGILSPRIFAMLVIMALVTTFMTGPLLTFSDWLRTRKSSVTAIPA